VRGYESMVMVSPIILFAGVGFTRVGFRGFSGSLAGVLVRGYESMVIVSPNCRG
jgi:hypothetical protein